MTMDGSRLGLPHEKVCRIPGVINPVEQDGFVANVGRGPSGGDGVRSLPIDSIEPPIKYGFTILIKIDDTFERLSDENGVTPADIINAIKDYRSDRNTIVDLAKLGKAGLKLKQRLHQNYGITSAFVDVKRGVLAFSGKQDSKKLAARIVSLNKNTKSVVFNSAKFSTNRILKVNFAISIVYTIALNGLESLLDKSISGGQFLANTLIDVAKAVIALVAGVAAAVIAVKAGAIAIIGYGVGILVTYALGVILDENAYINQLKLALGDWFDKQMEPVLEWIEQNYDESMDDMARKYRRLEQEFIYYFSGGYMRIGN